MVLNEAAVILWDGDKTILMVCDPDMNEEDRKRLFEALMNLQVEYHSREKSAQICSSLTPIPKQTH